MNTTYFTLHNAGHAREIEMDGATRRVQKGGFTPERSTTSAGENRARLEEYLEKHRERVLCTAYDTTPTK